MTRPAAKTEQKPVAPEDINWTVLSSAYADLKALRRALSAEAYKEQVAALKDFLCGYFNSGADCTHKISGISPLGHMPCKGKAFKVRWALPGGGKSTGIRLAVSAICESKQVRIVGAWLRRDDPSDEEFADSFRRQA